MWLYLGCPQHSKYMHTLGRAQHKANEGTGVSLTWGKAKGAGIVQLHDKKGQGCLINLYSYLMGGKEIRKEKEIRLFSLVPPGRTRSNRNKWKHTYENTCSVWTEEKFFLLWGWSNRKKYSLGLSGSIQICNCWYVWRRLKGTRCLKGTNSQYPHDQEGSLSEYQSPSQVYIAKIWLSASQILHERSHHQMLFFCVCGKLAYSICPDGAEIPILRYLCMIWRFDLQDFFDAPQKVCVACGTG